jgi:hypothetical protein
VSHWFKQRARVLAVCPWTPLIMAVVFLGGCRPGYQLDTAPVSGKVLVDGKPLATGTVLFTPMHGRGARGVIKSDGSFTLSTYRDADGAILGEHRIAVIAYEGERNELTGEDARALIPHRYMSPESSGLSHRVVEDENDVVLNITSK